jgi:glycine/D-amino acid oxidase-like deaminating enzyme
LPIDRGQLPKPSVYWHDTEPVSRADPLDGEARYDVCVVGAGYTGLWTAYFLRQSQPALHVAVLEAQYAGAGASGHNDGFVLQALGGHGVASLTAKYGSDGSGRIFTALRRSALEIGRLCVAQDLDVDFEASPIYSVAAIPSHRRKLAAALRAADELGIKGSDLIGQAGQAKLFGSVRVLDGYRIGGGLLNPFKLVRALARLVVADGVALYESTPVTSIKEAAGGVTVSAGPGRVYCHKVVLATDAFQHWYPPLARQTYCVRSYILVSQQLSRQQLERLNWRSRAGFIDGHSNALFGRLTRDNRILLGGGFAAPASCPEQRPRAAEQSRAERRLTVLFRYLFPQVAETRPEYIWGGAIGVSADMLPHVGALSPNISYAYGYSGHGIVATQLAAKILRDITLEADSDEAALPFVRPELPPSRRARSRLEWLLSRHYRAMLSWTQDRPVRRELRRSR